MKNICEHFYANQWAGHAPKRTRQKSPQRHNSKRIGTHRAKEGCPYERGGSGERRDGVSSGPEIHNIILTWRKDSLTAVNSETSKSYRKCRGVSFAVPSPKALQEKQKREQ